MQLPWRDYSSNVSTERMDQNHFWVSSQVGNAVLKMHTCIHTCHVNYVMLYVRICVNIYTPIDHVCVHLDVTYMSVYVYICIHVFIMYVWVYVYVSAYMYLYLYLYLCMHLERECV